MIRLASSPAPNIRLLARSALTMLSSPGLMKESRCELPASSDAALDVLRDWAKGGGEGADDTHPASLPERQLEALTPDHPLDIAIADWDALFSAVEVRLMFSVGEQSAAAPHPQAGQAGEAAERVRSTVLECVGALHQLHLALTHEREQRDHLAAPGTEVTQPAAPG